MPPRGKKIDPVQLAQQFNDWKISEESKNWNGLLETRRQFEVTLTATSPDITFDLSKFLLDLYRLVLRLRANLLEDCFFPPGGSGV